MNCWLRAGSSFFHFSQALQRAEGTKSSHPVLATQTCCKKTFILTIVGEYNPKMSYTRAMLDAGILFVRWHSSKTMFVVRCSESDFVFYFTPGTLVNLLATGSSLVVPGSSKLTGRLQRASGLLNFHFPRRNPLLLKSCCSSFQALIASDIVVAPMSPLSTQKDFWTPNAARGCECSLCTAFVLTSIFAVN